MPKNVLTDAEGKLTGYLSEKNNLNKLLPGSEYEGMYDRIKESIIEKYLKKDRYLMDIQEIFNNQEVAV